MKKISPIVWEIAYRAGMICAVVQAFMALGWMFFHLSDVPGFAETEVLLNAAGDWNIDEYTGALYVLVIAIFRWGESLLGLPFQIPLYFLQFVLGLYSVYSVLAIFSKGKGLRLWAVSVYVNTIPYFLQAHFSVLPYSAGTSMFFLLVSALVRASRIDVISCERGKKAESVYAGIKIILQWTMVSLLVPDYYQVCSFMVMLFVIYTWLRARMRDGKSKELMNLRGWLVLFAVTGILVSGTLAAITTQEGSRGRMQNTISAQAVRRLAWPELFRMNDLWKSEIKETFSAEDLTYYSAVPERVLTGFGPVLEEKYGKEKADQIYADMAYTAFTANTKEVTKQFIEDFLFYICPPITVEMNLKGIGGTYSGWEYEKLQNNTVELTEIYTDFSTVIFALFVVCAMCAFGFGRGKNQGGHWIVIVLLALFALHSTWLTGGMVSYLACPIIIGLWGISVSRWLIVFDETERVETK